MLKLFSSLNLKLWWRSLQGIEVAAILFYSVFIIIATGQFFGVILVLLFTSDIEQFQSIYPWLTEEVHLFANLLFVNAFWFTQVFFTKISRLRINENRKLLSFGMPVKKLTHYLNLAGFMHPLNLIFQVFWLIYLGFMAQTAIQYFIVFLLILVNYGLITSIKWRFRKFSADRFKYVSGTTLILVIFVLLLASSVDYQPYLSSPQVAAQTLTDWLYFLPGYIFFYIGSSLTGIIEQTAVLVFLLILAVLLNRDIHIKTKNSLLSPPRSSSGTENGSSSSRFMKWLGREGGKYFYTVWNHRYSKLQLLITYVFVVPYVVLLGNTTYIIGVLLTLIPIIYLMVLLTNMFGFENRELLLSLQMPIKKKTIVTQRIMAAILVSLAGSSIVFILVPIFIESVPAMIQVHLGILTICLVFLHYIMTSCIENYKKIEEVSVMSVSNPVLPISMSFSAMFIVMILGLFTFFVFEEYIWFHILALICVDLILGITLIRKINSMAQPFQAKVIPKLWNEL
ncbi:MAG: hypothetical protein U5K72_03740 [Balneolaceae bacterium]|nr:hypothetical protein [Balneolaceae bacterium]